MRIGRSLDELGHTFSWLDLWSFVKYCRIALGANSVIGHVLENPPVDPETVPTKGTLTSIKDRLSAKRAELRGAQTQVVSHNRRDRKTTV